MQLATAHMIINSHTSKLVGKLEGDERKRSSGNSFLQCNTDRLNVEIASASVLVAAK